MKASLIKLTEKQISDISSIEHLTKTEYFDLDFQKTLQYIIKRYIIPITPLIDISNSSLVDCGSGYGWLAFGYLLSGGKHATLCDIDEPRLEAAKEISKILGVFERCSFVSGPMESLVFRKNEFDIFACIETLEHVGEANIDTCIDLIANSTKEIAILTTPNKFFPLVLHDNKVPLSHWLPSKNRNFYTNLFGIKNKHHNDFVSPLRLTPIRKKFKPFSKTLTFSSYSEWKNSYPFYSPYNSSNRWKEKPPFILKVLYFSLTFLFGIMAYYFYPNLCRVWIKRSD